MATSVKKTGLWDPGMAFDVWEQNVQKNDPTDRGVAIGVKKTRSDRPRCGHWSY